MAIVNLFDEQMTESAAEDLITDLRRKLAETTNALLASRAAKDIAVSAAYEQGKQAGAMKCCRELSEQEPVAYECVVLVNGLHCEGVLLDNCSGSNVTSAEPLIRRPSAATKGDKHE